MLGTMHMCYIFGHNEPLHRSMSGALEKHEMDSCPVAAMVLRVGPRISGISPTADAAGIYR